MARNLKVVPPPEKEVPPAVELSPTSHELVVGVVGYAGAGCSAAARRLEALLSLKDYNVHIIKLSSLIERQFDEGRVPPLVDGGARRGISKLKRACALQDLGDELRATYGARAVAALAVREIKKIRGPATPGEQKIAFVLDSLKHADEVDLLRRVYDLSFRLIAVHCERTERENRLIGDGRSVAKYSGADKVDVIGYMERDEKDKARAHGQQVRDAFYRADFFIDNNAKSHDGENLTDDLDRFINLLLGAGLVRPTKGERAMYHAHAAALQSSCLSRQVGAALTTEDGTLVSTGTNDVPKFGGGVYDEASEPDCRCFAWEWSDGQIKFSGCHNDRKKNALRKDISRWLAEQLSDDLAFAAHPKSQSGIDTAEKARKEAAVRIRAVLSEKSELMETMPGVKDIIEYSRSIHAEMNALFAASRSGVSPLNTTLYCTTYPCHNCARHLVTAGVGYVYYIEPYVKSLATELHCDAIATELPAPDKDGHRKKTGKMVVVPFTGVGPRMYEDFFAKRGELKDSGGKYLPPEGGVPAHAVRLRELMKVEESAADLVPEKGRG